MNKKEFQVTIETDDREAAAVWHQAMGSEPLPAITVDSPAAFREFSNGGKPAVLVKSYAPQTPGALHGLSVFTVTAPAMDHADGWALIRDYLRIMRIIS